MDRRHFLQQTALAGAAVLVGCRPDTSTPSPKARTAPVSVPGAPSYEVAREAAASAGPARQVRLVAEEIEVEVGPDEVWRTWGYNGEYPGPEIRLQEGERLEATVENRLPADTTIHWHGLPVPNPMDGVPGLTQEPVPPGGEFVYAFAAEPAGSYLYHSHVGLQLDRGLIAPLIVEEREPHVAYDREVTLVLDDYLPGTPEPLAEGSADGGARGGMMGGRGMMGRGRRGGMGGMMGDQVPPYAGLLINGRLPSDPVAVEVRRGERLRMRVMNPSGATTFRFAVGGHRLTVTHADGYPVRPVTVDALLVSMGERYDVVLEADNPGAWPIAAATVEGDSAPAQAVLRYRDAAAARPPAGSLPDGLGSGRLLRLDDLRGVEDAPAPSRPDRTFDLTLSGGMMSPAWTIDGQAYPDAAPLEIREGERVRVTMFNRSPMIHPMHLHGHFFRTGDLRSGGVRKDTVLVPAHMGRAAFEFVADNPGRWFFHCHNVYHLEAGMAREVRYV
jgi:FtsP/CotA-like multicopper oxidase with cupredoxin domain